MGSARKETMRLSVRERREDEERRGRCKMRRSELVGGTEREERCYGILERRGEF